MAIWVLKDGQREGPYEEQDVRELIYEGTYTGDDLAIRGGHLDWTTLGELLDRAPAGGMMDTAEPPPMPRESVTMEVETESGGVAMVAPAGVAEAGGVMRVEVVDFRMPFGSVMTLMLKWVMAWMLVVAVLGAAGAIFWLLLMVALAGAVRH